MKHPPRRFPTPPARRVPTTPALAVDVLFAGALRLHQDGRTVEAVHLYEQILKIDPRHSDSLHLLGMAAYQARQNEVAIDLIGRAIDIKGDAAAYHSNLGTIFQAQGRLDEAASCYARALALDPGLAEVHLNLGLLLQVKGSLAEAAEKYRAAVQLKPELAEAYSNLGNVLEAQGKPAEAADSFRQALKLKPQFAEAHYNLGNVLQVLKRWDEAAAAYRKALELKPMLAEAHCNLGNVLVEQKQLDEAELCLRRALALKSNYPDAHYNLGNVLAEQGKTEEAVAQNLMALALNPYLTKARNNLGNLYRTLERPAEAVAEFLKIPEGDPEFSGAYNNLGLALMSLGRHDEAIVAIRQTLALEPEMAEAFCNLGAVYHAQGRLDEAVTHYQRALELKPELPKPQLNLGMIQLQRGNFAEGWKNYEMRWENAPLHRRDFTQPQWDGAPLAGKRILLHAEQGYGDTLQFLRYVPLVQAAGGTVVLEVQERMVRLAAELPGVAEVVGQGAPLPAFDCHAPLLSLPMILGTTLADLPARTPYLTVPAEARKKAEALAWPAKGLRVGLIWAGKPSFLHDPYRFRTVALPLFQPLVETEGTHWFSLQIGAETAQLAEMPGELSGRIIDLSGETADMADTAAQIVCLDLVVSVDTAVAHLAGALGVPTWVLLPFASDWRWIEGRADCPWYPEMRLFQQTRPGDWETVISRMRNELATVSRPRG